MCLTLWPRRRVLLARLSDFRHWQRSAEKTLTREREVMTGECRLCKKQAELQLSHILPAFVFKWQKASSGNGHLRSTEEPNARVQDGVKRYWLCSACEGLFSRSERSFATELFHPYIGRSGDRFRYGPWMLHFCVSVSWRLLSLALEETAFPGWSDEDLRAAKAAEAVWREFLLGQRPHPGACRQHLLPVDEMVDGIAGMEPNFNRYMMRAIQMDLCRGAGSVFTYAKLGRFMIFGSIVESHPEHWHGTKVNANEGVVEPRKYSIPGQLRGYWNEKARMMADALASVSPRQKGRIEKAFKDSLDRYAGSDAFAAMEADVRRFGKDAFQADGDSEAQPPTI